MQMINLLPPKETKILLLEMVNRLAIILSIIGIVFLASLTLALLSVKFYILADISSQETVLNQAEKINLQSAALAKEDIQKYNSLLLRAKNFYASHIYFSGALKTISGFKMPKGLYLTDVYFTKDKNNMIKAAVSGFSASRDDLISYKKSIESNKTIKDVSFSQDSWISPEDINFKATFYITQNESAN